VKRLVAIAGVLLTVAAAVVVYQYRFLFAALAYPARVRAIPQAATDRVVDWAASQSVAPGRVRSFRLPVQYAAFAINGFVSVARLKDGRTCALLIEGIGYKDNFEGVLTCSAPLRESEVVRSANYPRSYISLPGYGRFEELYISSKRNDRTYDVYFDLN